MTGGSYRFPIRYSLVTQYHSFFAFSVDLEGQRIAVEIGPPSYLKLDGKDVSKRDHSRVSDQLLTKADSRPKRHATPTSDHRCV